MIYLRTEQQNNTNFKIKLDKVVHILSGTCKKLLYKLIAIYKHKGSI